MSATDPRRSRAYAALHTKAIRRAVVLAGIGSALIAVALVLADTDEDGLRVRSTMLATAPVIDPLAAEFARCNRLGTAAADDPACRAAWAENRRRFFGGRAHPWPAPVSAPKAVQPLSPRPQIGPAEVN